MVIYICMLLYELHLLSLKSRQCNSFQIQRVSVPRESNIHVRIKTFSEYPMREQCSQLVEILQEVQRGISFCIDMYIINL